MLRIVKVILLMSFIILLNINSLDVTFARPNTQAKRPPRPKPAPRGKSATPRVNQTDELRRAILSSDLDKVKELLAKGVDVNATKATGRAALMIAAEQRSEEHTSELQSH